MLFQPVSVHGPNIIERIVGDKSNNFPVYPGQAGNEHFTEIRLYLKNFSAVNHILDNVMHIIGPSPFFRQHRKNLVHLIPGILRHRKPGGALFVIGRHIA